MRRPGSTAASLRWDFSVLIGFLLLSLGLVILLSLVSYHIQDPSLDTAATARPLNLLGYPGSYLADLAFQTFGFAPFQARFNVRDALRDRVVILSDGTTGTAHGTSEAGALLVHTARGMNAVTSSEVSVRPAP